jgi:hypothetical protein
MTCREKEDCRSSIVVSPPEKLGGRAISSNLLFLQIFLHIPSFDRKMILRREEVETNQKVDHFSI